MSTIELIDTIKNGDNVKANKAFDTVMGQKLNDALDARKIELASATGKSEVKEPAETATEEE
jgi:hypothetical protein